MKNVVFAFGPGNTYIFNAPKQWARRNLPPELDGLWSTISDIYWAAFGPDKDQYFLAYIDKSSVQQICYGDGLPPKFTDWLLDPTTKSVRRSAQTRVALGPNNSFLAWDTDSIRWSNIPSGLESSLHEWLSPSGWIKGPPRLVALGGNDAYFALSEYAAVSLSMRPAGLVEQLVSWVKDDGYDHGNIVSVSLHPTDADQYILIRNNGAYSSCLTARTDAFYNVIDSLCDEATIKTRKAARDKAAKEKQEQSRAEEAEKARQRQQEQSAAAERAKAAREAALSAELPALYRAWKQSYEKSFVPGAAPITTFPNIPRKACICAEVSCALLKSREGSLMACRHDVESLLRASGAYSLAWLRRESLAWHPDRFGVRCDPDYRKELCAKTTQLFVIFGELIETEKGPDGRECESQ